MNTVCGCSGSLSGTNGVSDPETEAEFANRLAERGRSSTDRPGTLSRPGSYRGRSRTSDSASAASPPTETRPSIGPFRRSTDGNDTPASLVSVTAPLCRRLRPEPTASSECQRQTTTAVSAQHPTTSGSSPVGPRACVRHSSVVSHCSTIVVTDNSEVRSQTSSRVCSGVELELRSYGCNGSSKPASRNVSSPGFVGDVRVEHIKRIHTERDGGGE